MQTAVWSQKGLPWAMSLLEKAEGETEMPVGREVGPMAAARHWGWVWGLWCAF